MAGTSRANLNGDIFLYRHGCRWKWCSHKIRNCTLRSPNKDSSLLSEIYMVFYETITYFKEECIMTAVGHIILVEDDRAIKRRFGRYPWGTDEDRSFIKYICEETGANEQLVRDIISAEIEYLIKK